MTAAEERSDSAVHTCGRIHEARVSLYSPAKMGEKSGLHGYYDMLLSQESLLLNYNNGPSSATSAEPCLHFVTMETRRLPLIYRCLTLAS